MKMIKVNSFLAAAIASATLYGCASTDDSMDNTTAMEDEVTMSETQTMAGSTTEPETEESVVVTSEVVAPVAVIPLAELSLENTEELDMMFDGIEETENHSVLDLAKQSANLSTFVYLMESSGLANTLTDDGSYTVFAPTNEAFSKVSKADMEMLLLPENKAKLSAILQTHILPNEVPSTAFNSSQRITLDNDRYIPVTTQLNGTQIIVGGATIVVPNVEASNGIIHVVDNVIIPKNDAVDGDLR